MEKLLDENIAKKKWEERQRIGFKAIKKENTML